MQNNRNSNFFIRQLCQVPMVLASQVANAFEGFAISISLRALGTGAMFVDAQKKLPKKERGKKEKGRELYNL